MAAGDIVNQHLDIVLGVITWPFTPSVGNALIVIVSHRGQPNGAGVPGYPAAGWTLLVEEKTPPVINFDDAISVWGRDSDGTESGVGGPLSGNNAYAHILEVEGVSIAGAQVAQAHGVGTTILCGLVTTSAPALVIGAAVNSDDSFFPTPFAPGAGWTEIIDYDNGQFHPHTGVVTKLTGAPAAANPEMTSEAREWWGATVALVTGVVPPPPPPVVEVFDPYGATIAEFENLIDHKERIEWCATGSGYLIINRHDPQATKANLAKGNIVRATYSEIDAEPVAEWIIEDGDFKLVDSEEEGGEDLTFSGRGSLALAAYTRLGHQNLTDPPRNYPLEGVWRWESEEWAGIVRRMLDEAQAHTPPALTMVTKDGWSDLIDSDGNPFFDMDGVWEARMGEQLLGLWLELARAGMGQLEMRPGFLLRAYDNMGADRSGAFGPSTVRFEAGVNITTEVGRGMEARLWASSVLIHTKDGWLWYPALTGGDITGLASTNVLTGSVAHGLAVGDSVRFTALNGGAGLTVGTRYFVKTVPSPTTFTVSLTDGGAELDFTTNVTTGSRLTSAPYIKEELLDLTNMDGTNAQERAAARRLLRGEEAQDAVIFEHSPIGPLGEENDPEGGWYYPGWEGTDHGRYWIGDLVSFHTGTGEVDYNERVFRVHAITLGIDETGAMAPPIVELNSPWGATDEAQGSGSDAPASSASQGTGSAGGGGGPHVHTQYQPTAAKGQPEGYAELDVAGLVPSAQLGTGGAGAGAKVLTDAQTFVTLTPPATALDDLTDVVITAPVAGEHLRHDGAAWVNSSLIWKPVMDGSGAVVTDSGTGEAIMTEVVP